MNTVLAPKVLALSIKRVMSTKLNLPAAVSIASNVAMPKKENPSLGEAQGFIYRRFIYRGGFRAGVPRRTAGLAF